MDKEKENMIECEIPRRSVNRERLWAIGQCTRLPKYIRVGDDTADAPKPFQWVSGSQTKDRVHFHENTFHRNQDFLSFFNALYLSSNSNAAAYSCFGFSSKITMYIHTYLTCLNLT